MKLRTIHALFTQKDGKCHVSCVTAAAMPLRMRFPLVKDLENVENVFGTNPQRENSAVWCPAGCIPSGKAGCVTGCGSQKQLRIETLHNGRK